MTETTQRKVTLDDITKALIASKLAAEEAGKDLEDGGTCNMDSPAFRVDRMPESKILEAAKAAGVRVSSFTWFSGRRWFWVLDPLMGQGNRRSRMSGAATKAMREALEGLAGVDVMEYQQMD